LFRTVPVAGPEAGSGITAPPNAYPSPYPLHASHRPSCIFPLAVSQASSSFPKAAASTSISARKFPGTVAPFHPHRVQFPLHPPAFLPTQSSAFLPSISATSFFLGSIPSESTCLVGALHHSPLSSLSPYWTTFLALHVCSSPVPTATYQTRPFCSSLEDPCQDYGGVSCTDACPSQDSLGPLPSWAFRRMRAGGLFSFL